MSKTVVYEKRSHRRVAVTFPVGIGVKGVEGYEELTATNVSFGGVFLSTEYPCPVGTEVSLKMRLPALEQPVQAKGTVVRCLSKCDANEGAAGMGIQFNDDTRIDWDVIKKLAEE